MSTEATRKKRERQSAGPAPARRSVAGRNLVPSSSAHPDIGRAAAEPEEATAAWREELLKDVASKIADGSHNPPPKQQDGVPMLSARNISANGIEFDEFRFITQEAFEAERKRVDFQPGDVLLTIVGSIGRTAVVPELSRQFAIQRSVAMIRPQGLDSKFCMYQLQSERVQKWLRDRARGSAQQGVYLKTLANLPMLIAPLADQLQIVAEIEKQFTRLDAGVAALRRVQANLKRYRAAVLKAACQGRLVPTEAELARAEGRTYETGEQLLARILADRRKNWHGRGKYKEPTALQPSIGAEVPDGWAWTGFEQLADGTKNAIKAGPFGSALKKSSYAPRGYKIYGQEQVIRGDPYYGDYFIRSDLFERLRSCEVKAGDILISLVGTAGKVLVLPKDCASGIINPRLLKLSLHASGVEPRFIKILLESTTTRAFFKLAAHGGTMEILNLGILKSLPIALPPLAEQKRIVAEVERHLSVIEELEAAVSANLQRATRLRQSILQHAFAEKSAQEVCLQ